MNYLNKPSYGELDPAAVSGLMDSTWDWEKLDEGILDELKSDMYYHYNPCGHNLEKLLKN